MRIGEIASSASVSIQALRYYERRGLLPKPARRSSGYRFYEPQAITRVRFIKRAQDLGFTLEEISELLALWERSETSCGEVEAHASATLQRIEEKIRDLGRMRTALRKYVAACRTRASLDECPLLGALDRATERAS